MNFNKNVNFLQPVVSLLNLLKAIYSLYDVEVISIIQKIYIHYRKRQTSHYEGYIVSNILFYVTTDVFYLFYFLLKLQIMRFCKSLINVTSQYDDTTMTVGISCGKCCITQKYYKILLQMKK